MLSQEVSMFCSPVRWNPRDRSPIAVANVRVCLALLRLFRGAPLAIDEHGHESIGKALWPVVRLEARRLREALRTQSGHRTSSPSTPKARKGIELIDLEVPACGPSMGTRNLLDARYALPEDPDDDAMLRSIGRGLTHDSVSFRVLFDALEQRLESRAKQVLRSDRNIAWLCAMLELDPVERDVLSLCAAIEIGSVDAHVFALVISPARQIRALRMALGLPDEHALSLALSSKGRLHCAGLLQARSGGHCDLEDAMRLSKSGAELVAGHHRSLSQMSQRVLQPLAAGAARQPLQWPHLQGRTDRLRDLLRGALQQQARGVNLLLYGAPGTGKTEYARALIASLRAEGFRVLDADRAGNPATRAERLASLHMSAIFAPPGCSVILLDEAEDIFQSDYGNPLRRAFGSAEDSKAWMNNLLEHNRVPVIWISNEIEHLDPAYVRRFTYCLAFPTPPRAQRRQLALSHLGPVGVSEAMCDRLALQTRLSPALIASAARYLSLGGVAPAQADAAAQEMLSDHARALGHAEPMSVADPQTRIDLRYLRTSGNTQPAAMMSALERVGQATVMLVGPPGTGKTQLAAEIAHRLGRDLTYRTAADIHSKWFGESEQNVARLFSECDPKVEVLFVDEAETLLGSRASTDHRADVAVTAEFLRRLEGFEGVFICATNHAGAFDPALMRRFVFRLELLPMDARQREDLLVECLASGDRRRRLAWPLTPQQLARLGRLDQLTPGDFANVQRRMRLMRAEPDVEAWLAELALESAAKSTGTGNAIGFL
ncbi:AAA family ATPase [Variovorax saccharolyticus]|uniref:AAA family ATPase n=1 Tax=Variovorax saccharolyticus TaxID=3053516 RepID=UPI002576BD21|nr:ATP-binding protein [Variovorax sp. J22R187]MDM0022177.1 ATP-binding protein [Variovorax sp. J22R187]